MVTSGGTGSGRQTVWCGHRGGRTGRLYPGREDRWDRGSSFYGWTTENRCPGSGSLFQREAQSRLRFSRAKTDVHQPLPGLRRQIQGVRIHATL